MSFDIWMGGPLSPSGTPCFCGGDDPCICPEIAEDIERGLERFCDLVQGIVLADSSDNFGDLNLDFEVDI